MSKSLNNNQKQNNMSKSTTNKKKGKPSQGSFPHYFLLNVTPNGDGSVTVSFAQVEPVPDGNVVKWVFALRRNGAVDPEGVITWEGIERIGGAWDGTDTQIFPQSFIDTPPVAGTYTYNVNGEYGVVGDELHPTEMGSNWVVITV